MVNEHRINIGVLTWGIRDILTFSTSSFPTCLENIFCDRIEIVPFVLYVVGQDKRHVQGGVTENAQEWYCGRRCQIQSRCCRLNSYRHRSRQTDLTRCLSLCLSCIPPQTTTPRHRNPLDRGHADPQQLL